MKKGYDVVIIGAGIAGICTAYELSTKSNLEVLLLEQGNSIYNRVCPLVSGKCSKCIGCKNCSIMKGYGGAGNFSDGKYNFTTEFGGWLTDYMSPEKAMDLIMYVDEMNMRFVSDTNMYKTINNKDTFSTKTPQAIEIEKKALQNDLHLLHAKVKHLGTENNLEILKNEYEYLKDKVDIYTNTKVDKIEKEEDIYFVILEDGRKIKTKFVVASPGRSGAEWFSKECIRHQIPLINNQIDIGVRVELPNSVFEHITNNIYEAKLLYRTKRYGDIVRTFCMNPNGYVVTENVDGLITVNGHSYSDKTKGSQNVNFALLVSNRFTKPFNDPYLYGKRIASFSNLLGQGVIVQRFGDLMQGRRTNAHRLSQSFVKPTLKAEPGDLSLVLPKRHLDNIIEMIYALDKIAPGTANYDTLLYGVEVKFYSARPQMTNKLEIENFSNFYSCGDGAGVTRGLAQAGASGIYVARNIIEKLN